MYVALCAYFANFEKKTLCVLQTLIQDVHFVIQRAGGDQNTQIFALCGFQVAK